MMVPFRQLTGVAAPLLIANVNTDVIIRIETRSTSPEVLGPEAFAAWRFRPDGTENPDFALNRAPYRGAPILLAGANFGCGSSRERAVWALQGIGIRCIVAPSFAPIFEGNCFQNGLLPVVLEEGVITDLARRCADGSALTVDLETKTLGVAGAVPIAFEIDARRRECLLQGLDDIDLALQERESIRAWQSRDRAERPWIWALEEDSA